MSTPFKRAAIALALALGVSAFAPAAHAFCRTTTNRAPNGDCSQTGAPLYWNSTCVSFSLQIGGTPDPDRIPLEGDEGYRTIVRESAMRWRAAPCDMNGATQPYFEVLPLGDTTTSSGTSRDGPNVNVVSFNPVWRMDSLHDPQAVAITIVTFDVVTGEIFDADLELNSNNNSFTLNAGPVGDAGADIERIDLPTVLTHEFGHFQGLSHNHENALTVMYPSVNPGEVRRNLTTDDALGICAIYPPENPPDRLCNLVPYGGLAITPNGGRVTGGCGVVPGSDAGTPSSRGLLAVFGLLAVTAIGRRRVR